jgi:thiamine-monophosphate kinase
VSAGRRAAGGAGGEGTGGGARGDGTGGGAGGDGTGGGWGARRGPGREAGGAASEDGVLAGIFPLLPAGEATELGPGDDSAVVRFADGRVAVSTDMLVEGVHFRLDWSRGEDVGWRVAAQNLADAAAVGAAPRALVVALSGPPELIAGEWGRDFARGLGAFCAACGTGVVGGDLTAGPLVVACGTVLGDLGGRPPVRRAGARPGDQLALRDAAGLSFGWPPVLGLGASAAGLAYLERRGPDQVLAPGLVPPVGGALGFAIAAVGAYLRPQPPVGAGAEAARAGATAMLDVSDGLVRDAWRMAQASAVRLVLEAGWPALARAAAALEPLAAELGGDVWEWVLGGGEDHALLAAFPPRAELPPGWLPLGRVEAMAPPPPAPGRPPAPPPARGAVAVAGLPPSALGGRAADAPDGLWQGAPGDLGWDHIRRPGA